MPEHQNIEYKESWRDEYLKWICGFANANGGKIFIGIDDKGNMTDLRDYKKPQVGLHAGMAEVPESSEIK
jgi:ATP-dependent DNA helicase RecG